jgi:hypothetical protein
MSKSAVKHRGYVEEWVKPSSVKFVLKRENLSEAQPLPEQTKEQQVEVKPTPVQVPEVKSVPEQIPEVKPEHFPETKKGFTAGSMILSLENDMKLTGENGYQLAFNTGMVEGSVISINEKGDTISFADEGSYRFELCGDGVGQTDVTTMLVYESTKFTEEMKPFTNVKLIKLANKLNMNGVSTILPVLDGQTITIKIVPSTDDTIIISAGTRLLIHRVA